MHECVICGEYKAGEKYGVNVKNGYGATDRPDIEAIGGHVIGVIHGC